MIEKFGIFLKIIVCLLAVCRTSIAQYDKFYCVKADDKNNSTIVCTSYSNKNSILPVEDIPDETESLIISTSGNGSLAITGEDIFQNFKILKNLELRIGRSLHIEQTLLDYVSINHLRKVLFNLPNLKKLSLEYNQFNDKNYSWILPVNLEKLYISNGVFEFDLQNCSHLVLVRLNHTMLRKIPYFHDPFSTLKILDLRNNSLNEFSVNDIAAFCHLKYYAMDTSQISNCECNKLKQWIVKLQEWGDFTFHGSLNCTDTIDNNSNCTLEESMLRRGKKCSNDWTSNNEAIFVVAAETVLLAGQFLFVCIICYCALCCFYLNGTSDSERDPIPYWSTYPYNYTNDLYSYLSNIDRLIKKK